MIKSMNIQVLGCGIWHGQCTENQYLVKIFKSSMSVIESIYTQIVVDGFKILFVLTMRQTPGKSMKRNRRLA